MSKIESLSLNKLARKIQSGELSCVKVASKYIENIEKYANLNAFIHFDKNSVIKEAKKLDNDKKSDLRRLHGVPLIIKDNIHVKDIPNTAGCAALKHFIPRQDSDVVKRLRSEGALVLGKANLDEMFINYTGENANYGNVKNPYNPEYSAGGSSGGVGCAIASRQAPAGLGTDTNGSIRVPSSVNGVYGFRPTIGRYSSRGMTPLSSTKDTIGPMAKSIGDLIFLDRIITDESKSSEKISKNRLKIGVPKNYLTTDLDPEVENAFEQVKISLSRNNIKLVDVDMKSIAEIGNKITMIISTYEAPNVLREYLAENKIGLSFDELVDRIRTPDAKRKFKTFMASNAPKPVKKEKYDECMTVLRPRLQDEFRRVFKDNELNVLISPSLVCLPVRLDAIKGAEGEIMWRIARNCIVTSNTGIPSVTVPMGRSKLGLPIGLQLEALWNQDRYLLNLSALLQRCWINLQPLDDDTDFDFDFESF